MLPLNVQDISPNNPLVIKSPTELKELVASLLTGLGIMTEATEETNNQSSLTTKQAKAFMKKKGYQAKSHVGFTALMKEHGITPTRRGRDHWWDISQLNKIPNKI